MAAEQSTRRTAICELFWLKWESASMVRTCARLCTRMGNQHPAVWPQSDQLVQRHPVHMLGERRPSGLARGISTQQIEVRWTCGSSREEAVPVGRWMHSCHNILTLDEFKASRAGVGCGLSPGQTLELLTYVQIRPICTCTIIQSSTAPCQFSGGSRGTCSTS
jgi:hypothetical protein